MQIRDERQFKALTGTTSDPFERLEAEFSNVYRDERRSAHENAVGEGTRKRKPGGGRKGILSQIHLNSGKRKDHTVKNTILATKDKIVSFVGKTFCGSRHDFSIFRDDFPPETEWFRDIALCVDMAYTEIRNIYVGKNINVPYRRPRKSEKNPTRKMDMSQTNYNRAMAKIRIFVENSIAGLKRYRIMAHDFRNRKEGFVDDTIANCAGLWNMMLGVAV